LSQLSCSGCPVLLFVLLTGPGRPVGLIGGLRDLSRLTYKIVLSNCHTRRPVLDVLSRLYCYGSILLRLSCSVCPVPAVLSMLSFSGRLSSLSCPACPILTVYSGCTVQTFPSQLSSPNCPFQAFLSPDLLSLLSCL
jgi:hypothetical protein